MENIPWLRGFVDTEFIDKNTGEIFHRESLGSNLILNQFREYLPLLLAPQLITGRADNSAGIGSWLDRRIALIGFGVGDGALVSPSVKPEDPEDGRSILVGEPDYVNSKQGLQGAMRRIPLTPSGPSEINSVLSPISSYYLLKEVDPDGVAIVQTELGGAELRLTFTVEDDEFVGNIFEYVLYLGGGVSGDNSQFEISPGVFEKVRLDRENAIAIARKTRARALEKTRDFKFRTIWRIRT